MGSWLFRPQNSCQRFAENPALTSMSIYNISYYSDHNIYDFYQENLSYLPKTYKTLINTPRKVDMVEMIPGQYFHAGLKKVIISSLESLLIDPSSLNKVRVIFNVDESSVSASSRSEMHFCIPRDVSRL